MEAPLGEEGTGGEAHMGLRPPMDGAMRGVNRKATHNIKAKPWLTHNQSLPTPKGTTPSPKTPTAPQMDRRAPATSWQQTHCSAWARRSTMHCRPFWAPQSGAGQNSIIA